MLCYGINPRPMMLRRPDGRVRSARDTDIAITQNLLLDIDLLDTVTPARLAALVRFLRLADKYFHDLGLQRPVRAATGRGSHLLLGYPPILTTEHPDVADRLRDFKARFAAAHRQDLARLEARVDGSTLSLRAMARVYGTPKPGRAGVSRFYGRERVDDAELRDYLLRLDVQQRAPPDDRPVTVADHLPDWFTHLLATDAVVRSLWRGRGKPAGTDQTSSGYDFSLVRSLAQRGYTDPDVLGTIMSLRPRGWPSVRRKERATWCARSAEPLSWLVGNHCAV
jgi:hypothetical protein